MATTGTTGILTPAQESQLAVWLDDLVKLKGFWELIDGYIFKILITLLDDKGLDKLKVDLKAQLAKLVDAALAGQVDVAEQLATDILDQPMLHLQVLLIVLRCSIGWSS